MDHSDSGTPVTSPSGLWESQNTDLRFETNRFRTFRNWPENAPIEAARVAKAGFFYSGNACEVECFACGGKISDWDYGDQAITRHRQLSPECPFVRNRSNNVPIEVSTSLATSPTVQWLHQPVVQLQEASPVVTSPQGSRNGSGLDCLQVPCHYRRSSSPFNSHASTSEGYASDEVANGAEAQSPRTPVSELNFDTTPLIATSHPGSRSTTPVRPVLSHHDWNILRREDMRLRTFNRQWSATFLLPVSLVKAGFFYLGTGDHVQCAFCRGVIAEWEPQDDPRTEHARLFSQCPFVLGLPVGNVPLGEEPPIHSTLERTGSLPANPSAGFDIAPRFVPELRHNAVVDTTSGPSGSCSLENLQTLGVPEYHGPKNPSLATLESRLKTFGEWPVRLKQTPAEMASAGFYYLGKNDHVKCFHCDGGLRNWEPEDDPWIEHARWFPRCAFLLLLKGDSFVQKAMDSKSSHIPFKNICPGQPGSANSFMYQKEISEDELELFISGSIGQAALSMGVSAVNIKEALRDKIRSTGSPFTTLESLLEKLQPSSSRMSPRVPDIVPKSPGSQVDRTAALLEEENRRLKEARLCKICLDCEISILFLPCCHLVTCVNCAVALQLCPLCRQNIKGAVRTYFS